MKAVMIAAILAAQTAGSQTPQTTGYPECDKFIQMVNECIRTKMPPSVRAEEQQRLDTFRGMLNFVAGPALGEKCAENIRLEIQRDRYGCYAAEAARTGIQTPCSLVTQAEVQQIVGRPLRSGEHQGARCVYAAAGSLPLPVVIEVHWTDGREQLAAARDALRRPENKTRTATGDKTVVGTTVPGLGDDAFFLMAGLMPLLHVRKGDAAIVVEAQGASDVQLVAIARKALERLRPRVP